jgi:hypothetical protein
VAGLDVNAELLELARAAVPGAEFREGETGDPLAALREARRVAATRVAVLKWPYCSQERGPPLAHRLRPEAIRELAEKAGYASVERLETKHLYLFRLVPHQP